MHVHFLGNTSDWYKKTILFLLILNTLLFFGLPVFFDTSVAHHIVSWLFIGEFIFTLAMALKCYPLQTGGILAIQILLFRLADTKTALHEVENNLEVILLLMFMVAGIYFMKPLLMYIFGRIFIKVKSKILMSLLFTFLSAFLSAFLDALTVTAVLINVFVGFFGIYHKIKSEANADYNKSGIKDRKEMSGKTMDDFRSFLRSLIMHSVVGTALGGVMTLVGEPQNLLIGEKIGENFMQFFQHMSPITVPVLFVGLLTTVLLEKFKIFGYGQKLPADVREIIKNYTEEKERKMTKKERYNLVIQALSAVFLIFGLAFHIAPVGFIGLGLIIFLTAFMGITDEHALGESFKEALPFTSLLVVFFVIVAMIQEQELFKPIVHWALNQPKEHQAGIFYIANALLSMISDNVFVATVYINEVFDAYKHGIITKEHLDDLAVAINTGTNLPSIATPNGQAALLFLLTSPLAPLIKLSYGRMVKMALPYTIIVGGVGLLLITITLK